MWWLFTVLILILGGCSQVDNSVEISDETIEPLDIPEDSEEVNADTFMREKATTLCINACKNYEDDLSKGPCLEGDIINDWACDIVHSPRTVVDNLPENQCATYREGTSTHFVELTPDCDLIRTE